MAKKTFIDERFLVWDVLPITSQSTKQSAAW